MQSSKHMRFGGIVLTVWAIAVLAMLISAWIGRKVERESPFDGATLVRQEEVGEHV